MSETPANTISPIAEKYLRLQRAPNLGPVCVRRLVEHFGSIDAVFDASIHALERVEDVGRARAEAAFNARKLDGVADEIHRAGELGLRIICVEDDEYPRLLRHIPDRPVCLYVRGRLCEDDALAFAIVGSRRCSRYGIEQAERFAAVLSQAGFTVVSGLARGADAAAHRGALLAGGRTIAVQGCGLRHVYPPEHAELARQVQRGGAVVSELPVDTAPDGGNFPPRNRIIVGMCVGVLIIEAGQRSGALISARLANEYNREAFALPGLVTNPYAYGTNALIRDGAAKLVSCLDDILDELKELKHVLTPPNDPAQNTEQAMDLFADQLSPAERSVLAAIDHEETPLEAVCDRSGLSPAAVAAALTRLQIKGVVAQHPGNRFTVRRRVAPPRQGVPDP